MGVSGQVEIPPQFDQKKVGVYTVAGRKQNRKIGRRDRDKCASSLNQNMAITSSQRVSAIASFIENEESCVTVRLTDGTEIVEVVNC